MNTRGKTKNKARSHSEVKDRKEVGGREEGADRHFLTLLLRDNFSPRDTACFLEQENVGK